MQKCYNLATVKGTSRAGGICGTMSGSVRLPMDGSSTSDTTSKIENCYNKGTVISTEYNAGGILGHVDSGAKNQIVNYSYNTGNVTGATEVGGIVGYSYGVGGNGYNIQINNSYNLGTVSSSSADGIIGGVCGSLGWGSPSNVSIYNSYNEGDIGIGKYYGGIVGKLQKDGTVTSCKYKRGTTDAGIGVIIEDYGREVENSRGDISGQAEVATSLPTVLFVVNGGLGFKADSRNINNGYPILSWQ